MSTIGNVITAVGTAIGGYFGWKNSKVGQARAAAADAKKETKQRQATDAATDAEVYTGDKDAVNSRIGKLGLFLAAAIGAAALSGCLTAKKPIYVPADREVSPMTNSVGVAGWFVPNATFSQLLKSAQRAQDMQEKAAARAVIQE